MSRHTEQDHVRRISIEDIAQWNCKFPEPNGNGSHTKVISRIVSLIGCKKHIEIVTFLAE